MYEEQKEITLNDKIYDCIFNCIQAAEMKNMHMNFGFWESNSTPGTSTL